MVYFDNLFNRGVVARKMTELFINDTGTIGLVIIGLNNITGSLFLTLLLILIVLIAIALAFRIPLEAVGIIYLPFILTLAAYTHEFLAIFGCALIYLGVLFGKNILRQPG